MTMNRRDSQQSSELGEGQAGSWERCWDVDETSLCALTNENSQELNSLVEDKEVAAKAVALVVNSTRKGIVPLCADVAGLIRTKRRLEHKVHKLQQENATLSKSLSVATSTSTSPAPASTHSSDQHRSRSSSASCSACSSTCSSHIRHSPTLDKGQGNAEGQTEVTHRMSAFTVTEAYKPNGPTKSILPSLQGKTNGQQAVGKEVALPEMVSEPIGNLVKILPRISIAIQCSLIHPDASGIEVQFKESLHINSQLAEELGSAKKEIEQLTCKLKELEMNLLAKESSERFFCDTDIQVSSDEPAKFNNVNETQFTDGQATGTVKKKTVSPLMIPGPLEGCLCKNCRGQEPATKATDILVSTPRSRLQVKLGDHVVLRGDRTGYIRYLGHLDGVGQANVVFAGICLDASVGRHDGTLNGKRYFTCSKNCGMFIPLHEVICSIGPQVTGENCSFLYRQSRLTSKARVARRSSDLDYRRSGKDYCGWTRDDKRQTFAVETSDFKFPREMNITEGHCDV